MMVERFPNLKEEVGSSNPGYEISSLLDRYFPGGQLPPVLWRWPIDLLSPTYMYILVVLTHVPGAQKKFIKDIKYKIHIAICIW